MKKIKLILIFMFFITIFGFASNLPLSKEATIIENVSSAEVLMKGTGIYKSKERSKRKIKKDIEKNGIFNAIKDAKRAIIYYLLYEGTDPILSSNDEKNKFQNIEEKYFEIGKINNYITYESTRFSKKIIIDRGKGIKIAKSFKVNKELLMKDLTNDGVLIKRENLVEKLGNPSIMVIPMTKKGENPIELLNKNDNMRHISSVIESYLTAKQYDVVVPEQQEKMNKLNSAQMGLADAEEDFSYKLALSVGSDIYITFSGELTDAGYGTKQYVVNLKAYETTTSRLLGTETGYSNSRDGNVKISIEEAVNDAMNNILSRINNYWVADLKKGIQYKLVINCSDEFDEDELEDIQFELIDIIEKLSNKSKENIVSKNMIDYSIWVSNEKLSSSFKIYRYIKKEFGKSGMDGRIKKINLNRKMIILEVSPE
ncbi:DUF6175 family protein [Haliovirga abyssi]|uniref:DUF2066 domain-containing protein n=1 Tax=Haliovirga abyssi TaxID=2996794 RepID=A0AAU9DX98_9FUSO|nr:DUF6175 family protein [Haliovirga abyssi]BDU51046.1 hypothetical protein HLVA_16150 [Haliovirga abyssi]